MKNKIFIGGLNFATTEQMLDAELAKYGKVVSLRIVTHTETGKSKGFGFVTFSTEEEAKLAIDGMNNNVFDGRRIGVKEAIDRA